MQRNKESKILLYGSLSSAFGGSCAVSLTFVQNRSKVIVRILQGHWESHREEVNLRAVSLVKNQLVGHLNSWSRWFRALPLFWSRHALRQRIVHWPLTRRCPRSTPTCHTVAWMNKERHSWWKSCCPITTYEAMLSTNSPCSCYKAGQHMVGGLKQPDPGSAALDSNAKCPCTNPYYDSLWFTFDCKATHNHCDSVIALQEFLHSNWVLLTLLGKAWKSYVQVPMFDFLACFKTDHNPVRQDWIIGCGDVEEVQVLHWWSWAKVSNGETALNVLHLKPLHWPLSLCRDTIEHLGSKKAIKRKIRKEGKQGHRVAARWKWYSLPNCTQFQSKIKWSYGFKKFSESAKKSELSPSDKHATLRKNGAKNYREMPKPQ